MPGSPGRVPNPAHRIGLAGARPLHVRMEELRERAYREIPPGAPEREVANAMETEQNFDLLYDALTQYRERKQAEQPQPSRWVQQKLKVLYEKRAAYRADWQTVRELQKRCARLAYSEEHRLLGTLDRPEVLTVPGQINQDEDFSWVIDEAQADSAIAEIDAQHENLRERWLQPLRDAAHYESLQKESQNRDLIMALWQHLQALETRGKPKPQKRRAA